VKRLITLTANGAKHEVAVEPRQSLLQVLREELHLTGTKEGCSEGEVARVQFFLTARPWTPASFWAGSERTGDCHDRGIGQG
jgi:xanthine dehydrogenase iron-sulfur cluster and FAD-binding subunit A